ncbi:hypothetical protein [Bowmanella yangjiangensis]|uniref:Uncharacterized protein n=1 Tax=Bowmanella yangjiangensis TaxID=2811230 RepID=A0ABS3D0L8_9ALTE|nr:hypothetical protein [Bowmanella yangjiangensis]MBN7822176.1 hypothetical protein [Bowmanella yangjiangensis]
MTDKPTFTVINGTPPPDTPKQRVLDRVKASRPADFVSCHRCGGMEVIETKTGVTIKAGKKSGGTKQLLCASCFMRGERVVIG